MIVNDLMRTGQLGNPNLVLNEFLGNQGSCPSVPKPEKAELPGGFSFLVIGGPEAGWINGCR